MQTESTLHSIGTNGRNGKFEAGAALAKVSSARSEVANRRAEAAKMTETGIALAGELVDSFKRGIGSETLLLRSEAYLKGLGGNTLSAKLLRGTLKFVVKRYERLAKSQRTAMESKLKQEEQMRSNVNKQAAIRAEAKGRGITALLYKLEGVARDIIIKTKRERTRNNARAVEYNGKYAKEAGVHFSRAEQYDAMAKQIDHLIKMIGGDTEIETITKEKQKTQDEIQMHGGAVKLEAQQTEVLINLLNSALDALAQRDVQDISLGSLRLDDLVRAKASKNSKK